MASSNFVSLSVTFIILFHGCCFAQIQQPWSWGGGQQPQPLQQHRHKYRRECIYEKITVLEPIDKVEAEAGFIEFWDNREEVVECAGVSVVRHTIKPKGLLLPFYSNSPKMFYILQGKGLQGVIFSSCPETYQAESESAVGEEGREDQHQQIREFWEGGIVALPGGVTHWIYNNGNNDLVIFTVEYISHPYNQLDETSRRFFLAGNPKQSQRWRRGEKGKKTAGNMFKGFDVRTLSQAFGIESEVSRKLRGEKDERGPIISVKEDLQVLWPGKEKEGRSNGAEESSCRVQLIRGIDDPQRADIYNPNGGRINMVNSDKLLILRAIQLSAERGVLYQNAMMTPEWNTNSHSIVYITKGTGRFQIVGESGQTAFDGEVRPGQLIVVPQNFAILKKAGKQGVEWIEINTIENAIKSQLAGRVSAIRSMPAEVLKNSYQMSMEEVKNLKQNRQEMVVVGPRSRSQ